MTRTRTKYGFWRFVFDLAFGFLTCGIWWVFLLFKFIRSNS